MRTTDWTECGDDVPSWGKPSEKLWPYPHWRARCPSCGELLADAGWRSREDATNIRSAVLPTAYVYDWKKDIWQESRRIGRQRRYYRRMRSSLGYLAAVEYRPKSRHKPETYKPPTEYGTTSWTDQLTAGEARTPGVVGKIRSFGDYPQYEVLLPVTVRCKRCRWPISIPLQVAS